MKNSADYSKNQMDTFEIKEDEINIETIMSKIQENIKNRKQRGAYDPQMEILINQPFQKPKNNQSRL